MNFNLFLLTIRARWLLFTVAFACTVIAAAAVTLAMPRSYKATVTLLVDAKDEQSLNNARGPLVMPQDMLSYLQTQSDIITSEKVARRVVDDLRLAVDPELQRKFREQGDRVGSLEDWLAESLRTGLDVQSSQSSVIRVSFTAPEARLAADIANGFAHAYVQTVLELRVAPTREAAVWFDEQLKRLRVNLEQAQAQLTDYHRQRGIVSADEHYDVETTRLGVLADQVLRAQEQSSGWRTRDQQARASLATSGATESLPEVLESSLIQKLKEDLTRGEARLRQLSTQIGANHPDYQRQASDNQVLRQKIDAEMKMLVTAIGSSAAQSRQREEDLRRAMAAQRTRILDLKEDRNELTVLRRNAESAERAYDTAMQRFVASQVDSRASQTNVSILNEASAPRQPFRPRTLLNLAVSVIVGTILGTCAVLLAEMLDRRVRSRRDLELDVPLLAVLNASQLPAPRREARLTARPSPAGSAE